MQAGKTAEAPETTASSPSHSQKILDFSFLEVADVSELVDKLDIAIDAKEKDPEERVGTRKKPLWTDDQVGLNSSTILKDWL